MKKQVRNKVLFAAGVGLLFVGAVFVLAVTNKKVEDPVRDDAAGVALDKGAFEKEWAAAENDLDGPQPPRALGVKLPQGLPPHELYPQVGLSTLAANKWIRPRALVTGKVTYLRVEDDKDIHFVVEGDGAPGKGETARLVCEIIPELPLPRPKLGDTVWVWGIVRWDGQHRWAEIHPVIGWVKE